MKRNANGAVVKRANEGEKKPIETPESHSTTTASSEGIVLKFTNCRILRDGKLVKDDLWVKDGKIIDERKRFWAASTASSHEADEVIDCMNAIIAPGKWEK
jgi:N-acetylglucosamine-6-phosphate deacetylase